MDEIELIEYRGQKMRKGWPEEIAASQEKKFYLMGDLQYPRIKYGFEKDGEDSWNAADRPCPDCLVAKNQYHVPSCDIEECPKCHEQVILCQCVPDTEKEEMLSL